MILAWAVIAGLTAGLIRAWVGKRPYRTENLKGPGLVLIAFLPQLAAFYLLKGSSKLPDAWAPYILVGSQVGLLGFAWLNRKVAGFWLLGPGLLLNFLVIVLNGGLMPISPEMVRKIYPGAPETSWQVYERLGSGKDIVLPVSETRLWFLSDRFVLPGWMHYQVAFSAGDVLIALGVFWLLWALGGKEDETL